MNGIKTLQEAAARYDEIIRQYLQLQDKHPTILLGGSATLIWHGDIPMRYIKDLDIVTPVEIGKQVENPNNESGPQFQQHTDLGICFDMYVMKDRTAENRFSKEHMVIDGRSRTVFFHDPSFAWRAKFDYVNKMRVNGAAVGYVTKSMRKHAQDIKYYMEKIKNQ